MVYARGMEPELREARRKNTLLQTEVTGWDVGNGVVYLASDQSAWVSGIILSIDAGSMAGTVGKTTPPRAFEEKMNGEKKGKPNQNIYAVVVRAGFFRIHILKSPRGKMGVTR